MKKIIVSIILFSLGSIAFAAPSNDALVNEYLRVNKFKETFDASSEAIIEQYSINADLAQRESITNYIKATTGWDVVKAEAVEIVKDIYTSQELEYAIHTAKSKTGARVAEKGVEFSRRISTVFTKIGQEYQKQLQEKSNSETTAVKSIQLTIKDFERQMIEGKTYFTGRVVNEGVLSARGVEIEVNLFKGSKFVDQYSTYIKGNVPAGGERLFKISCGCSNEPAPHDKWEPKIVEFYETNYDKNNN